MASHRPWQVAAGIWTLAIAIGSLMPGNDLPSHMPWDKLQHGLGYGMLAALLYVAGLTRLQALISAFVFGVAVEYAQCLVPGRMGGDWEDILANTLGALAGLVLATIVRLCRRRR